MAAKSQELDVVDERVLPLDKETPSLGIMREEKESQAAFSDLSASSDSWRTLIEKIYSRFGGEGDGLLFDMGHRYGSDIATEAKQTSLDGTRAFDLLSERATMTGLGRITAEGDRIFGENLVIKVESCPFCSGTTAAQPSCHFLKGVVSGLAQVLYGKAFNVSERNCAATGGACCEFAIETETFSDYKLV